MTITADRPIVGQSSLSFHRSNVQISIAEPRVDDRKATLLARTEWAEGWIDNVAPYEVVALVGNLEDYLGREIDREEMEFLVLHLSFVRSQVEEMERMMRGDGVVLMTADKGTNGEPIYGANPMFITKADFGQREGLRDLYESEQESRVTSAWRR